MIQRNAPALGFTFEEARAARLWSGQSLAHYQQTQQQARQVETATDAHAVAARDEAARASLRKSLRRAMGLASTGHQAPGMRRQGTISLTRGVTPEEQAEWQEEVRDAVPLPVLNPQSRATHYHPRRKD